MILARYGFVLLLCGCRFGWSTWQGAPPRAANAIKLGLYTRDEVSAQLTHQVLARDPHLTVVDLDASKVDPESFTLEAGCNWARAQQLDYYAVGAATPTYKQDYVCTGYSAVSVFEKNEECTDSHYENMHTIATFSVDVYDVADCRPVPSLSTKISTSAEGEEEQSKPEALQQLITEAIAKTVPFPDQINIAANGGVDAPDGYYALYSKRAYHGFVAVHDHELRSLHCCVEPTPGDALVARGQRKLVELALDGAVATLSYDGTRRVAFGAGVHVRYYPLDAGFRFGFGADLLDSAGANIFVFTPEIGWGFRPSSAVSLSANLGLGWARAGQVVAGAQDTFPGAYAGQVMATARIVTFFTGWWYVGADVGYVYAGAFDAWEGKGAAQARPMSLHSPISRVWLGFDL